MGAVASQPGPTPETAGERPDLTAWRQRHELRRSNAAQPVPSGRAYKRADKHRKRDRN